ncbi:MAG: inositol monophosphatase [Actinobacteria bacterium]|nr:inositol monophosphatase [Actinomycetota bacterium]
MNSGAGTASGPWSSEGTGRALPAADTELVEWTADLARRAGELTLDWFGRPGLIVDSKIDGTPVTAADRMAEKLIRTEIALKYPDDTVLGEEHGLHRGKGARRWVVDPIDGTKGFTRGIPLYATLLAVEDDLGPLAGVIALPALSEMVVAGRGWGCWLDRRGTRVQARVSSTGRLKGAYLTTSGFEAWDLGALGEVHKAGAVLRTWGDGYGFALVATGRVDAMVDPLVSIWDVAPVPVIMAEAGGRFSDLSGACRLDGGSGVASNGHIHAELLQVLSGSS